MTGIIRSLNFEKGYGFIVGEDKIDRFFHRSSVQGGRFEMLAKDLQVEFEHEEGERGPRARDVRVS